MKVKHGKRIRTLSFISFVYHELQIVSFGMVSCLWSRNVTMCVIAHCKIRSNPFNHKINQIIPKLWTYLKNIMHLAQVSIYSAYNGIILYLNKKTNHHDQCSTAFNYCLINLLDIPSGSAQIRRFLIYEACVFSHARLVLRKQYGTCTCLDTWWPL